MEQNKSRYLDPGTKTYRRVKMKDIGQATLAFLGEPGNAKDKSRTIFENEEVYLKVFPDGVRAQQLMLPWKIYLEADHACEAWDGFAGATYARFCLTAVVGAEFAKGQQLPSAQEASKLFDVERVRTVINRAQSAVAAIAAGDGYPGHREFFRSADFFGKVLRTYKAMPKS